MSLVKKWGDNTIDDFNGKCIDCMIYKEAPDVNQSVSQLYVGCGSAQSRWNRSLISFYVKADLIAAGFTVVHSAKLYLYGVAMQGAHTVSAYRVVQNWIETQVTWNSFKTGSSWNTPGCAAAHDAAVDDDPSYDRLATPVDSYLVPGIGGYTLVLDLTSLVQNWASGSNKEYGILLQTDNEANNNWLEMTRREFTDTQRPYLEIDYSITEYKLTGTVKEKGVSVQRTLRSYIRSTGVLYDTCISGANGIFSLDTPDANTEMFVVAFDDDAGDQYNALIYDRVKGAIPP